MPPSAHFRASFEKRVFAHDRGVESDRASNPLLRPVALLVPVLFVGTIWFAYAKGVELSQYRGPEGMLRLRPSLAADPSEVLVASVPQQRKPAAAGGKSIGPKRANPPAPVLPMQPLKLQGVAEAAALAAIKPESPAVELPEARSAAREAVDSLMTKPLYSGIELAALEPAPPQPLAVPGQIPVIVAEEPAPPAPEAAKPAEPSFWQNLKARSWVFQVFNGDDDEPAEKPAAAACTDPTACPNP